MNVLRTTLVQAPLVWEDPAANRAYFDERLRDLAGKTDLVVLPEMFTSGFTMNPTPAAEPVDGPTTEWMIAHARRLHATVTGSLIIRESGRYYNRLLFVYPTGTYATYDKRHPFTMAGEQEVYETGGELLTVTYRGWRIRPLICYDLRFPVWARNTDDYDLLLYVANWPDKRSYDWKLLLRARAIENQAYVIGVNRIGTDAAGFRYSGDSCVIDPGWRHTLFDAEDRECVHTEELSPEHLWDVRQRLPFLRDRDQFQLRTRATDPAT